MKKILLVSALLLGLGLQGGAKNVTEHRTVGAFNKIVAEGRITLNLTQSNANEVSVETESAWQQGMRVEVRSGTLYLSFADELKKHKPRSIVNVSYKELRELRFAGSSESKKPQQGAKLRFKNPAKGDSLSLHLEGLDYVRLDYDVSWLGLYVNGARYMERNGEAKNSQVKKSGVEELVDEDGDGNRSQSSGYRVNFFSGGSHRFDGPWFAVCIVGIVFFAPCLTIVLVVYFVSRSRRRRQRWQEELYMQAVKEGKELPADFLAPAPKINLLNRGITWTMVGLGIMLFLGLVTKSLEPAAVGAIPFCLGVAFLLRYYLVERRGGDGQR